MALTAYFAVVVAVANLNLRIPIWQIQVWLGPVVAVFSLPFFTWLIVFGQRRHWFRFGNAAGFTFGGMVFGVLLFESPLPGALAGFLAGSIFIRIASRPQTGNNIPRRKTVVRFFSVVVLILVASVALTWRHHLAKYVIRQSGGRVSWHARSLDIAGLQFDQMKMQLVANLLGPYLLPVNTSVSFRDDPVRWGGLSFDDDNFVRLRPHLESIHGLDRVSVRCTNFGDKGAEQLHGLTSITHLSLIDTKVTDVGVESLTSLKQLVFLNVSGSSVTNDVVQTLSDLPLLRFVGLGGTKMTDDGVRALVQLPGLYQATVPKTGVTSEALSELAKSVRIVRQQD